jgi:hypothetical protein
MGPSDTAGQPVPLVEHEPTSAVLNEPSSATGEPRAIEKSTPDLGHQPGSVEPQITADGDSALGSLSEPFEASGAAGQGPVIHDEPLDAEVILINPASNFYADIY